LHGLNGIFKNKFDGYHNYAYLCPYIFKIISIIIMKEGKVNFFNESKGFGFIKDNESEKEYFVHVSGLIDEIRENDEVTFELKEGKKGLNAVNVKLL
jgi:CspA family cold shock protein